MEVEGTIIQIMPLVSGQSARTGNPWRKQEFLLETSAQYPKKIFMSLMGDKIDQFPLREGDRVRVSVDLESREYNGRWYSDIRAWKIAPAGQDQGGSYGSPDGQGGNNPSSMGSGDYAPSSMGSANYSGSAMGPGSSSGSSDPMSSSSMGDDANGADDLPF
ncbi:MAG: DUF3127 domain-containing protein [Bacteroidetes bacterium]|nr:DUF3127 domain-containing protein [Bacteroidota bacterium]